MRRFIIQSKSDKDRAASCANERDYEHRAGPDELAKVRVRNTDRLSPAELAPSHDLTGSDPPPEPDRA